MHTYIFQKLDGFNSNIPGGQSKGFEFPSENSGMDIGTSEYSNTNYRTRYIKNYNSLLSIDVHKLIISTILHSTIIISDK